jgi:chemotaxis protein methyltransferase CheR
MAFTTESLGLPDGALALLRDLIHERTGLFYENGKSDLLTDKLSPLVVERGFNSLLDYYYLLKYDTEADDEWRRVVDALSVQETYFGREADQVRALVDVIVPDYFSTPRRTPLRIWSAACATGEEPLSIAMALDERGWFERAPIEIYASDASDAAIKRAQRGVYRERSFRNLAPPLRERYFSKSADGSRIAPELQSRIRWAVANLMVEADVAWLATAPVIFCRNVFIYFSQDSIRKTVALFSRLMPRPGYLFVGASESLLRLTTDFDFQEIGGAFVYVKT